MTSHKPIKNKPERQEFIQGFWDRKNTLQAAIKLLEAQEAVFGAPTQNNSYVPHEINRLVLKMLRELSWTK